MTCRLGGIPVWMFFFVKPFRYCSYTTLYLISTNLFEVDNAISCFHIFIRYQAVYWSFSSTTQSGIHVYMNELGFEYVMWSNLFCSKCIHACPKGKFISRLTESEVKLLHENFSSRAVKRYLRSQDCTFWKDKKAGPYEHSVESILQAGSHQSPVQLSRA